MLVMYGLRTKYVTRFYIVSGEVEATGGFEPPNRGFADPRLATWPRRLRCSNILIQIQ